MKKIIYSILMVFLLITFLYGISRMVYQINPGACNGCARCFKAYEDNAFYFDEEAGALQIDADLNTGCGTCLLECPRNAIYNDENAGVIYGTVTGAGTGFPVSGAVITAGDNFYVTDRFGEYSLILEAGEYDVCCTAEGYLDSTVYSLQIIGLHSVLRHFVLDDDVDTDEDELSVSEALSFPNPVELSSRVRFSEQDKDIDIYNCKGQFVKRVRNEWDLKDYKDKSVVSGVYFFRIKGESCREYRKIVVK